MILQCFEMIPLSSKHEKYVSKDDRLKIKDIQEHCHCISDIADHYYSHNIISLEEWKECIDLITLFRGWALSGNYVLSNIKRINNMITTILPDCKGILGYRLQEKKNE